MASLIDFARRWICPGQQNYWPLFGSSQMNCSQRRREELKLHSARDKTDMEIQLEASGDINSLQRYRAIGFFASYNGTYLAIFLDMEEELRGIAQREEAIRDGDTVDEEELADLNKRYWCVDRTRWHCRTCFAEGPLTRGFELWRSHPRWYLHQILVEDCAGRGGCCGRDCGCCFRRHTRTTAARKHSVGHCTTECGCCTRARGFTLSEKTKEVYMEQFGLTQNTHYSHRIALASIWGLALGNEADPFSLIQEMEWRLQIANAVRCPNLDSAGSEGYTLTQQETYNID
ncbi:hypothetical protein ASPZODRAFT_1948304 [Penicilliopsis zonata CBS 506.65]|uniref:Uncharacterized protein n=1 Tax=Penicilliopsis zonata CBS 506.65 TaxID=1073090 RepID=A0A1L9SJZ0_9EURO|nr:hypothetical protein ASPZODRAFT_1948304 [Penicilliopsis zonata CBS 506.65]OJJ47406.1 hypothetical protein ASPZODRAFT_1948304 [Penicilliopsis zonata CBS 506.65]